MMKKRSFLALVLAFCLLAFSACGGQPNNPDNPNNPSTSGVEQVMKVGTFNDPGRTVSKEAYELLAETGINWVVVNKTRSHSQVVNILKWCEELNVDVLVMDGINNKTLNNDDYMQYKSFMGINMQDEPVLSDFANLAETVKKVEERYPDKMCYSNLFPDPEANVKKLGTETYEEYVDEFCKQVLSKMNGKKVLSFDIYPLEEFEREQIIYSVQGRYLSNLELIAEYAKKYDAEPQVYLQSICYANRRIPSLEDLNFQVYCSFAFGYRALNWFAYYTPGPSAEFTETDIGIVDRAGKPTEIYPRVKAMNEEIFKIDNAYLSYTWNETIPVYGEKDEDDQMCLSRMENQNKTVSGVDSVSAEYDAIVGSFSKKGGSAYMITNFREPRKTGDNKVTVKFSKAKKVKVWLDGEAKEVVLENNTLTLTLPAGEGAFVEVI